MAKKHSSTQQLRMPNEDTVKHHGSSSLLCAATRCCTHASPAEATMLRLTGRPWQSSAKLATKSKGEHGRKYQHATRSESIRMYVAPVFMSLHLCMQAYRQQCT